METLVIAAAVGLLLWAGMLWLFGVLAREMRFADEWELPQ